MYIDKDYHSGMEGRPGTRFVVELAAPPLELDDLIIQKFSQHSVNGLYRIDETRFDALDGGALHTLHEGGHLRSVYMMLASLTNLETLIERKNRKLAG